MTADPKADPKAVPQAHPEVTSSSPRVFDAILIGTGQAAPALAGRLTAAGMTVAIVERSLAGGTCVNVGCTPTKAMVASAYAARLAARGAEYGVILPDPPRIDMAAVKARVDAIVRASRTGLERWLTGMSGCTFIRGHARFESAHEVRVGDQRLKADKIFINVGGRAIIPDFGKLNEVPYLTNSNMVALDEVPRHLVVIGGSYIGLEFAQIFRRFGAQVTVVEKALVSSLGKTRRFRHKSRRSLKTKVSRSDRAPSASMCRATRTASRFASIVPRARNKTSWEATSCSRSDDAPIPMIWVSTRPA